MLLSGEEGVGKSALLRTVTREARERGVMVLEGRTQAVELPQPFFLLHELLSSFATQSEKDTIPQGGLKGMVALGFNRPGGRSRGTLPMGLLPFGGPLESPEERKKRLLAALSGRETNIKGEEQVLFDRFADYLDDIAADREILLAIDDLQHADNSSINFLGYLSRRSREKGTKVIASCRSEAEVPEVMHTILSDMDHGGQLHRLEVKGLTEDESREFLAHLSRGSEIPAATVHEWYTASRGNPLALEQLFRGGLTSGDVAMEGPARASAVFAKLSQEDRRILSHAATLGKSFRIRTLYLTVGGDEEKFTGTIGSLRHRGALVERGSDAYEFSSEQLWTEIYNSMSESHRRILHHRAAEAIETDESLGPIAAYDLAKHYYLSSDFEKSVHFNRQAAEMAKKSMDYVAAAVYLDQALQSLKHLPRKDQKEYEAAVLDLALCLDVNGDVDRAIGLLQEVASPGLLNLHLAMLMTDEGRWNEAEKLIMDTLDHMGASGDPAILGYAYRMLGALASCRGQYAEAAAKMEKAIPYLQKANMRPEAARVKLLLADQKRIMTNFKVDEIDADYKSGLEELRATGDLSLLASALINYGIWHVQMNKVDEGLHILEEALSVAENLHHALLTGWVLFNMADVLFLSGDFKRSAELNARAKERLEKVGDKMGLIQVHLVNARLMEQAKQEAGVEVELAEALRLAQAVGFEPDKLEVLLRQGEFFLQKGDREGAMRNLKELELGEFEKIRPELKDDFCRFRDAVQKPAS